MHPGRVRDLCAVVDGGDPSRVRVVGPLAPLQAGFAAALVETGYRRGSVALQLRLMAQLQRVAGVTRWRSGSHGSRNIPGRHACGGAIDWGRFTSANSLYSLELLQ